MFPSVVMAQSWPTTSKIKTYPLSSKNDTTVYQSATSNKKYGTIYATDLITIKGISGSRLKVEYPVKNGTKVGYVDASKITPGSVGFATESYKSTSNVTVYRRSSGSATIGSISRNDIVYVVANTGNRTQVIYPLSGTNGYYKMGWVNTSTIPKESQKSKVNVAEGNYILQSACGGKVLDVSGSGTENGTNIFIYSRHNGSNQVFNVKRYGNYYMIIASHSGKAVDINGGSSACGVNVHQWEVNYSNAQLWTFEDAGDGYYYITSVLGTRLDVDGASSADSTNVHAWEKNTTIAQKWKLIPVSATNSSSKNIKVSGVDIGYAAGEYFSKNGKACTCHNQNKCAPERSGCNCNHVNGTAQCYAFALWCENKLYGYNDVSNPNSFRNIGSVAAGKLTASKLKELISKAPIGSHIRTNGSAHSMILISKSNDGFTIAQANGSNNNEYGGWSACKIGTAMYTWNSYMNSTYGKRGIAFIKTVK